MGYFHWSGKKINAGMKMYHMMEMEAGHKLLEFDQEKQNKAKKAV